MIGTRDCVTNEAMEIPEYFVYCAIFIVRSCGTRSGRIAKGTFSEVQLILACQPVLAGQFVAEPMGGYYRVFVNDV